jgi:hypothetical protein
VFLRKLLGHLGLSHNNESRALDGIRSAEEFRTILNRERGRVNRNGHTFSVVVFDLLDESKDSMCARRLADVLSVRIRATDEIGWFDERCIGVILPYTTPDLAWKVPYDVCQILGTGTFSQSYSIYSYPSRMMPMGGSPDPLLQSVGTPLSTEYDQFAKPFDPHE